MIESLNPHSIEHSHLIVYIINFTRVMSVSVHVRDWDLLCMECLLAVTRRDHGGEMYSGPVRITPAAVAAAISTPSYS